MVSSYYVPNVFIADDMMPCAPAPVVTNARVERMGTNPGDITVYTCLPGYYLAEGGSVRTIVCSMRGHWSAVVQQCSGTLSFYL